MTFPNTLAFIGGGNMARSLIGGLIARGMAAQRIRVADPLPAQLEVLSAQYGVVVGSDNLQAASGAEVVILAVKPQQMRTVTTGLANTLPRNALLVSIAAGIRAADIKGWSGGAPVVRCMPNRPALHGCGITALYATADVEPSARQVTQDIMDAVGATLWVDQEAHMDAVVALSGSGPAYYFYLTEILEQTGVALGLSPELSRQLATATAHGAGCMLRAGPEDAVTLRAQVTSKGGTTAAALEHLEANDVRAIFATAVTAAARRSAVLAQEFGER
jgi:pyrroline-5-carboxylate reductase